VQSQLLAWLSQSPASHGSPLPQVIDPANINNSCNLQVPHIVHHLVPCHSTSQQSWHTTYQHLHLTGHTCQCTVPAAASLGPAYHVMQFTSLDMTWACALIYTPA
jgi:hypothetical protein